MNHWLFKSDPDDYGYDHLEKDRTTVWDGVRNNQALQYLRQIKKGDPVLVYHTGGEKQIVGIAEATRGAYPDPEGDDERWAVVEIEARERLPSPVSLSQIKADKVFADFQLVRMSRLSIMPVPARLWKKIMSMGGA